MLELEEKKGILHNLKEYLHISMEYNSRNHKNNLSRTIVGKDISDVLRAGNDMAYVLTMHDIVKPRDFSKYDGEWYYLSSIPVDVESLLKGLLYRVCFIVKSHITPFMEFEFCIDESVICYNSGYEWMYNLEVLTTDKGYRINIKPAFEENYTDLMPGYVRRCLCSNIENPSERDIARNLAIKSIYSAVREYYPGMNRFVVLQNGKLKCYTDKGGRDVFVGDAFSEDMKAIEKNIYIAKTARAYSFLLSSNYDGEMPSEVSYDLAMGVVFYA